MSLEVSRVALVFNFGDDIIECTELHNMISSAPACLNKLMASSHSNRLRSLTILIDLVEYA